MFDSVSISSQKHASSASSNTIPIFARNSAGDLARHAAIGGPPLDELRIEALAHQGLIERGGERLAATPKGRLVLNRLILELAA